MSSPSQPSPTSDADAQPSQDGNLSSIDEADEHNIFMMSKLGAYHMVRGTKMFGVLHDPGASSGLVGTDTAKDIMDNCLRVADVQIRDSDATLTGISGQGDASCGEIKFPLHLANIDSNFVGDLIGGAASKCPALLPLPTHIENKMITMYGYFDNRDGLLAIPHDKEG